MTQSYPIQSNPWMFSVDPTVVQMTERCPIRQIFSFVAREVNKY